MKKKQFLSTSIIIKRNLIEIRSENNQRRLDYKSEGIRGRVRYKRVIEVFLIICRSPFIVEAEYHLLGIR
jgi:hypothetical protein